MMHQNVEFSKFIWSNSVLECLMSKGHLQLIIPKDMVCGVLYSLDSVKRKMFWILLVWIKNGRGYATNDMNPVYADAGTQSGN